MQQVVINLRHHKQLNMEHQAEVPLPSTPNHKPSTLRQPRRKVVTEGVVSLDRIMLAITTTIIQFK